MRTIFREREFSMTLSLSSLGGFHSLSAFMSAANMQFGSPAVRQAHNRSTLRLFYVRASTVGRPLHHRSPLLLWRRRDERASERTKPPMIASAAAAAAAARLCDASFLRSSCTGENVRMCNASHRPPLQSSLLPCIWDTSAQPRISWYEIGLEAKWQRRRRPQKLLFSNYLI